jgi:hypothetical protein
MPLCGLCSGGGGGCQGPLTSLKRTQFTAIVTLQNKGTAKDPPLPSHNINWQLTVSTQETLWVRHVVFLTTKQ